MSVRFGSVLVLGEIRDMLHCWAFTGDKSAVKFRLRANWHEPYCMNRTTAMSFPERRARSSEEKQWILQHTALSGRLLKMDRRASRKHPEMFVKASKTQTSPNSRTHVQTHLVLLSQPHADNWLLLSLKKWLYIKTFSGFCYYLSVQIVLSAPIAAFS